MSKGTYAIHGAHGGNAEERRSPKSSIRARMVMNKTGKEDMVLITPNPLMFWCQINPILTSLNCTWKFFINAWVTCSDLKINGNLSTKY